MFSISDYGEMIGDKLRMDPYAYALKATVRPDSVVLDIGTGSGIHALLASKFGARKVYAVEPNDVIHLAKELAQVNGFGDRIEFVQDVSTRISLPEKADVIVSDLRGVLPLYEGHIPAIIDARQRHLAPGGILIPKRDTVSVSLVEAATVYKEITMPWDYPYGLSMNRVKGIVLNEWSEEYPDNFSERELLMKPQVWAVLDYATITSPHVPSRKIIQRATHDGRAHGLLLWFDSEMADGIHMYNGPLAAKAAQIYGCAFFPLLEAVTIAKGDLITLDIGAELSGDRYHWQWHTKIHAADDPQAVKAEFEQATRQDGRMESAVLHQTVQNSRPAGNEAGEIDPFILGKMDGEQTIKHIARQAYEKYPVRFRTEREALFYVHELAQKYRQ